MVSALVFVAVIAGSFLQINAAGVFQCDKNIIAKIEKLWNGENNDILEKAISYKSMALSWTTPNYLKSDVACCAMKFTKEDGNVFTQQYVRVNLNEYGQIRDGTTEVIENKGAIIDRDQIKKRYSVYSKNNVLACYVCLDSDKAKQGPPEGFIAVTQEDYCKDSVTAAYEALKSVGVKATEQYPDTCVAPK